MSSPRLCAWHRARWLITYLGFAGREAASGQTGAINKALLALMLLAVVALLPRLIRRFRGTRFVYAQALKHRLDSDETVTLIDVRTAEEFRGPLLVLWFQSALRVVPVAPRSEC